MPLSCSSSEHRSYFGRIKSSFVSHLKRTALKRSSSKASSQKLKRHSNGSEKKMLDWRFLSPEIPPLPPVTEKSPATLKTNPKSHERGSLFEDFFTGSIGEQRNRLSRPLYTIPEESDEMMMEDIKTPRTSSSLRPERTSDDSMGSWASSIHSAADEIQQHYQTHRGDESQCRTKFAQMVKTAYDYHHRCKDEDAGRMELVFDDSNCVCLIRTTASHGASEYWKFGGDDESLQYLPPEAATHGRHNRKLADIWILGISLYRLLIGKYPFSGAPDHRKLFVKMLHGDFRMPSHLSEDAKDLLRRMLAPDTARASLDLVIFHPWLRSCTILPPPSPPSSPLPSLTPPADIKSKSTLTSPEKKKLHKTADSNLPSGTPTAPANQLKVKSKSKKKRKMAAAIFKRTLLIIAYGPFPPPKQPYRVLASLGQVHVAPPSAST